MKWFVPAAAGSRPYSLARLVAHPAGEAAWSVGTFGLEFGGVRKPDRVQLVKRPELDWAHL